MKGFVLYKKVSFDDFKKDHDREHKQLLNKLHFMLTYGHQANLVKVVLKAFVGSKSINNHVAELYTFRVKDTNRWIGATLRDDVAAAVVAAGLRDHVPYRLYWSPSTGWQYLPQKGFIG